VETYNQARFLQNNIEEMENGFLPLLYVICVLGAIVLTTILSLLLSITMVERRTDFAVMKTLGSPRRFLVIPIIGLVLLLSGAGEGLALAAFFPLTDLLEKLAPEISTKTSLEQIAAITIAVGFMSLLSAAIALRRLRSVYPQESFM
jgi:ABC-type antimicrobial peptide transport system permease subunit